jgi:CspA family cold shock protein
VTTTEVESVVRTRATLKEATTMTREHPKLRGTVKSIKKAEGYGFVTHAATGDDYFFHRSQVTDPKVPFEALQLDQEVEFTPAEGPKGSRAMDVKAV